MRKFISLTLTFLLLLSVAACGTSQNDSLDSSLSASDIMTGSSLPDISETLSTHLPSENSTETEVTTKETVLATTVESEITVPAFTLPAGTNNLPPQTDPESHFMYGATLPDGYYLLMYLEGDQYVLYDELGHIIKTFHYSAYEQPMNYTRILPLSAVHEFTDPSQIKDKKRDFDPDDMTGYNAFPGGYVRYEEIPEDQSELSTDPNEYVECNTDIKIYNNADTLFFSFREQANETLLYQIASSDRESAIFIQSDSVEGDDYANRNYSMYACVVSTSGELIANYEFKNLPARPKQILSTEYIIAESNEGQSNIYNRSGELITQNVETIKSGLSVFSDQAYMVINIYEYYMQNGSVYDANHNEVPLGSLNSNGVMIPGMVYEVNGISCTAREIGYGWMNDENASVIAVGTLDDRTVIRTDSGDFEIISDNGTYWASNDHIVIMNENDNYSMYDLVTGKFIMTLPDIPNYLEKEYIITSVYDPDTYECTYTVIDKNGKIRLVSSGEEICGTNGEFIYMVRGPYQGIADLDGNWLIRSLTWEASRDAANNHNE